MAVSGPFARRSFVLTPRIFGVVLIGGLAAVLAFAQTAATLGLSIGAFRPLGAAFFSLRGIQNQTAIQATDLANPADAAVSLAVGRSGLAYAPLNTRALWLAGKGFEKRGHLSWARNAMVQAERITRRDAAVQLWLAVDKMRASNVSGGLRNLDLLIRTNQDAAKLATPILAKVLNTPDGQEQMRPYFRNSNPWLLNLTWAATYSAPSAAPLARLLASQPGPAPNVEGIRPIYADLVTKVIAQGDYRLALEVYRKLPDAPYDVVGSLQPDQLRGYAPFVWGFSDDGSRSGDIVKANDGSPAIEVYSDPGTVGIAASKLVAPGRSERLSFRVDEAVGNLESSASVGATCVLGVASRRSAQTPNLLGDGFQLERSVSLKLPMPCDLVRVDIAMAGGTGAQASSVTLAHLKLSR